MAKQPPQPGYGDRDERRTGRGLIWLGVSASVLVVAILSYDLLESDQESEKLRQFCNKSLAGERVENVAAKARKLEFDVRELQNTLLITIRGKRLGQSCFLTIVGGNVSDVHSVVTH